MTLQRCVFHQLMTKGTKMKQIVAIASMMLSITTFALQPAYADERCANFTVLSLRLDQNATDGDTELVVLAKGQNNGLKRLAIFAPNGRRIASFAGDRRGIGMREFQLESAEATDLPQLLTSFPKGKYTFFAESVKEDECLRGTATLSHAIAPATALLTPLDQQVVPIGQVLLSWTSVSGAARYVVQLNNVSAATAMSFEVSPSTTSLAVPAQFLQPDAEYLFLVGVKTSTGNTTYVERTFFTAR
jgi:hypothetical protein